MFLSSTAKRERKCHQCGKIIKPGEKHFITTSSGKYDHNVCTVCVGKVIRELGYSLIFGQM